MKILYLIDNFSLGGAQTIVKGLMENLEENSSSYAIALRQKEPEMSINHPNAITFQSSSKYSIKVLRFLKEFVSEKNIEILHCQLPRSIMLAYFLKRAFPKIKFIIHEQGDVFESRIHALLLSLFKSKADAILACSEATKNMLTSRAHIDAQHIRVLYNFVDLNRFSPGDPSPFSGKKIAFAGRIVKRKGWREFILAAEKLKDRKELCFYMAGTGSEVKKLSRHIRKQKGKNISYVGFTEDMKTFYQEMDLLVIPSHFEPMGMVAVEAMACGIPVLAANVPGLNEVVKHEINGWVYPTKSAGELVKAIEDILDGDAKRIDGVREKGIEDAQVFSLMEFTNNLQACYASLM